MGESEAANDLSSINQYKTKISNVARRYGQEPSLIAAIISRESSGGQALINGWGDNGNAFGLMQVDKNAHPNPKGVPNGWAGDEHLNQASDILVWFQKEAQRKFPKWNSRQKMRAALAGYNMGMERMSNDPDRVDDHTHQGNYSEDVLVRQAYYKRKGY